MGECYGGLWGPSEDVTIITKSLNNFIKSCNTYVAKLKTFDQYCIWRYTIGSASVNTYLITGNFGPNVPYWSSLFFKYYHNTVSGQIKIPISFRTFVNFFTDPTNYTVLSKDQQMLVGGELIKTYIKYLSSIILKGPVVTGEGFYVYKVSGIYPALPTNVTQLPSDVLQLPFNSTTLSQYFNFALFSSPDASCCLYKIFVPPGSKLLFVPTDLHAYNFEHEIILLPGSIFRVNSITEDILNMIDPKNINIQLIQDKNDIRMGNVYKINEFHACKSGSCITTQKLFKIYNCDLIT